MKMQELRLIDADTLIDEIIEEIEAENEYDDKDKFITKGLRIALKDIERQPIVDATPIVHAHWIEKIDWHHGVEHIHCTCSNCGYTVDYKPGSRGDGRGGKFCDDCGAKMDGGENK